jgi:glycosyltransferase involved in cell wall biosynthesis
MEIGVFLRREQWGELGFRFTRLKSVEVAWPGKGIVSRLLWVHVVLPLLCLWQRVAVLHKLATETPLFCSARRVTTIHDFYYDFLMEHTPRARVRLYERLEQFYFALVTRICFRRSRAIIVDSRAVCDEAARRYPAAVNRVTVVHLGAPPVAVSGQQSAPDHQAIHSRAVRDGQLKPANSQSAIRNSSPTFLYVAKFMTHKGQLDAIRAFERLAELHPAAARGARLRFRGFSNDRDYAAALRAMVARSPLAAQIEIVEYQATEGVQEIYRDATAVLLLSHYEGFGFPAIEAQSQGVPLICSDLPVLREVAGAAALFVNPEQAGEVANALHQMIADTNLRRQLRERGFQNISRFNWAQTASQTLDVYRRAMDGV